MADSLMTDGRLVRLMIQPNGQHYGDDSIREMNLNG